jgi:uncharacterized repeat protein (TIGR01451 family)
MVGAVVGAMLASLLMIAAPASAQVSPLPTFQCTPTGYLVQDAPIANMYEVDIVTGEAALVAPAMYPDALNSLAYNVQDDYLYATTGVPSEVVRIGADYNVENLGVPSNWAAFPDLEEAGGMHIGEFDADGFWWIATAQGFGTDFTWAQIDLRPGSATYNQVVGAGVSTKPFAANFADWAHSVNDGNLYTASSVDENGDIHLWRFDTTTQTMAAVANLGPIHPDGIFGAAYADGDGFLYFGANTDGAIFRVDSTTFAVEPFADGPASGNNDGAMCFYARIFVDYGDAPDSYGTSLATNGPRHTIPGYDPDTNTAPLMLGTTISAEDDGQPSAGADADLDDGLVSDPILVIGQPVTYTVTVTNDSDEPATLAGWIDLDGNRVFDAGERAPLVAVAANSGTQTYELTFPAGTVVEDTFLRLRLFGGDVADPQPTGPASGGEVEDYLITVGLPVLDVSKTADTNDLVAGETITYVVTVTNTGNLPAGNVTVEDTAFSGAGDLSPLDCTPAQPAELDPDASMTCTATYVVQQADVDAGGVTNAAAADGTPPPGAPDLVPPTDELEVPSDRQPGLAIEKTADTDELVAGETITYTFTAENTGNVTLTDVVIEDAEFTGAGSLSDLECDGPMPGVLEPGEVLTCTATYTVQQDDVDAGMIRNVATGTGTPPPGTISIT